VLRGWGAYFRYGHSSRKFDVIDRYVHERLALFASDKYGLPGRNWDRRFHDGLVPLARGVPAQWHGSSGNAACLAVNGVGEPYAGEPHVRFDTGPLATQESNRTEMGDEAHRPAPDVRTRPN
jgi:hypothetical protein